MTEYNQDIDEHFFEGSYKRLLVTVWEDEDHTSLKDLTSAEIIYTIFDDDDNLLIRKDSQNGADEIDIVSPATQGKFEVYIEPGDSVGISGTHNHLANVIDQNGVPEVVFSGRVKIFQSSYAHREREESVSAYLEGGT